ncbi:MAG: tRNA lysidine(34) synthetase TilS [Syntrophaceticus sp.]|nr:tRNA lysidine(34) synthetase TilS [Syntrophaceticus sp.]MDD4359134.1 tRNA lysidine(34) synthetase TilS [Syntrophaceticus sp.]MDD4782851.1 tRNA lysidine(34) synthetase TilS [Syntrophaceticus sp.]
MSAFKEKVEEFIKKENLIDPGMRVVVGVSGGADSVALLSVLRELAPSFSMELHVAHLNHLLRDEAGDDAAFVQRFAHSLEIPVTVGYARVADYGRRNKMSTEEAARWARYRFLGHVARKVGAPRIAVGHHLGDQVETVIFNFLRGAGPAGIAGIPVHNRGVVRPLLGVTREEIENYCSSLGLSWCTDLTNLTTDYQRNRIRVELLPYLRQSFNPRVDRAVAQTAEIISEEDKVMDHLAAFLLKGITVEEQGELRVSLDEFLSLPLALQRRMLRKVIRRQGGRLRDFGYHNYNDCLSYLEVPHTCGELHLPHGWRLIKGSGYFIFSKACPRDGVVPEVHRILNVPGETEIPELDLSICAEVKPYDQGYSQFIHNFREESYQAGFDYDKIQLPIFVRTRRAGDRIRPFGLQGTKKIKKLFNDLKVPPQQRDSVPLVVSDDEIYWVVGYRRGAAAPVTGETRHILLLQAH